MALATCSSDGQPAVRMVLLKGYDAQGFVFYTNYDSRKSQELGTGRAALCMYWEALQRQVLLMTANNDCPVLLVPHQRTWMPCSRTCSTAHNTYERHNWQMAATADVEGRNWVQAYTDCMLQASMD